MIQWDYSTWRYLHEIEDFSEFSRFENQYICVFVKTKSNSNLSKHTRMELLVVIISNLLSALTDYYLANYCRFYGFCLKIWVKFSRFLRSWENKINIVFLNWICFSEFHFYKYKDTMCICVIFVDFSEFEHLQLTKV